MCGIAGIIGSDNTLTELKQRLERMSDAIAHRGPDDAGQYVDPNFPVGLIHRRLSILDLSAAGHQPMQTPDGRYTIVFNGEIYNFNELKQELSLQGVLFKSQSDTEVLLHLFARDGREMVKRLAGMFAIAIWDHEKKEAFLARDPLGIKPIYVWNHDGQLAFASELRGVLAADIGPRRPDTMAMATCLMFGSVQEPRTIVRDIEILPAGHTLMWKNGQRNISKYWSVEYGDQQSGDRNSNENQSYVRETRNAMDETICRHFVSDVPVGIFLSGGIDSTAVVALAKANGFNNLKTFCISFDEAEFNEGNRAARTAKHFDTEHHDWRMTASEGGELVEDFLSSLEQPSNDGFNTFCVSKFARMSGMKVVLSGLGGDELVGGYPTFQKIPKLMKWHQTASRFRCNKLGSKLISKMGTAIMARSNSNRLSEYLDSGGGPLAAYWTVRAFFTSSEARKMVGHLTGCQPDWSNFDVLEEAIPKFPTIKDSVAFLETTRYMRNQLLRDSDVYSMAHGLELRVPFVDQRLYEAVNRIPSDVRHAPGKRLILDAVPEIPSWIAEAPKAGFRFPFEKWVKDQWKPMFDELERSSPVTMGAWYRKWIYFTLQHFVTEHRING